MTRKHYYEVREEIGILGQISTFMNYVQDMREIYPQFRKMTLDDIYEFLNERETFYELDIQKKLNVE